MRRILVTGANKGIGLAIVRAILEQRDDTFVWLGSRSATRGDDAIADLVTTRPDWVPRTRVVPLDVGDDASVTDAASLIAANRSPDPAIPPLYAVVNNAGVGLGGDDLDGILNVNTRGVRRVCEACLPLLVPDADGAVTGTAAPPGRIVNVTSASGPNFVATCDPARQRFLLDRQLELTELDAFLQHCVSLDAEGGEAAFGAAGLGDGSPYGLSKACANTYTRILARLHPQLHINACTPGFIDTDMTRPYADARGSTPADLGMKSPAQGTASAMHLLFGELSGSGHYYGSDSLRSPLDRYRAPGDAAYTGD